ncbi:hypothetical protein [Paraburkholderia sp. C35]|uniref:hypothetical protein n=1 Tax=Paraburkholderia sp. C35 TaxID=2126993 RepID=UPI000D69E6DD|nr:hypothetical protein [Paraburkholderia sp. C35]
MKERLIELAVNALLSPLTLALIVLTWWLKGLTAAVVFLDSHPKTGTFLIAVLALILCWQIYRAGGLRGPHG